MNRSSASAHFAERFEPRSETETHLLQADRLPLEETGVREESAEHGV